MEAELKQTGYKTPVEGGAYNAKTYEMKRCAERIWNAITRYVTFDKDGIFADPDWPHLWDHKR